MKKTLRGLLVAVALVTGGAAWAGAKSPFPVVINTTTRTASGSLGSARNSTDSVQYIGCLAGATSSYTHYVRCFARNAAGTTVSCYTTDYNIIEVVQGLSSDSLVTFTYNAGGGCTSVDITTSSIPEPKR